MKTLVIDRVRLFQEIISEILRGSSIEPVFAQGGEKALEMLQQDSYECICLSLHLDDADGIELCKRIRSIDDFRYTPIVLLSTESSPELIKRAMASGITDIFSKNRIHELVNFIERFARINNPVNGKVLYVEDNDSQREYVAGFFRSRGLEVDDFCDAEKAWEAFLKNAYDLVVTDIVLEGNISGVVFINKIRRLDGPRGDIPILGVTAFDNTSRRISLFHMGITDYVIKPIIQEELIARVSNLIQNKKAQDQQSSVNTNPAMEQIRAITHDYNNIIGIIDGYSELLAPMLVKDSDERNFADRIKLACKDAIRLSDKFKQSPGNKT